MNVIEIPQLVGMNVSEKINFVERIWDSIAQEGNAIPVPESHTRELDARFVSHQGGSDALLSLEELKQKVAART